MSWRVITLPAAGQTIGHKMAVWRGAAVARRDGGAGHLGGAGRRGPDLRAVAEAADQVRRDEALVTERVAAARARGRSWNRIAVALGVSRQAARHRFADKVG